MLYPKDRKDLYGTFGFAWAVTRFLQAICLIAILGMSANFIGEINAVDTQPPSVVIATLCVVSKDYSKLPLSHHINFNQVVILIVSLVVIYLLYLETELDFLYTTGFDLPALIALVVVSVKLGLPLSYLDCPALADVGVTSAFVESAVGNFAKKHVTYYFWIGASKTACYEMKAIWGFSMALCVLFFFSGIMNICLWKKTQLVLKEKDVEAY